MKYFTLIPKVIIFIFISIFNYTLQAQWITNHEAIYQSVLPLQSKGKIFVDPKFNTNIIRITDARAEGLPGIVPQYSKRQAWNSDESVLLLQTCSGRFMLFSENNSFMKFIDEVYGEDVFWHPLDPNLILFCPDSILYSYNVNTQELNIIKVFTEWTFTNTRSEGNLSNDGRFWAFAGQVYDNEKGTQFKDIVVFDLIENKIVSRMPLPDNLSEFDWVSISPLGNYVVIDYATMEKGRYQGVEVYDRNLNFIWQKPLGAGHSDLGIDENSDEVLVITYYDADSNENFIKKIRLSDGKETTLLKHHWSFYNHISCRNIKRNEWCFVSTYDGEGRLSDDSLTWQPFEDEIFALKLDGSGDVQRLCHHRSRRFSPSTPDSDNSIYFAEPHATVSPSGSRVVFGSNWRMNIEQDTSCDTYIIDLRNWLGKIKSDGQNINKSNVHYRNGIIKINDINSYIEKVEVYNILADRIDYFIDNYISDFQTHIDLINGVYLIKIIKNGRSEYLKLLVLE